MGVQHLLDPATDATVEWSRLDLARRIHDGVLQRLYVVSLMLESDEPVDGESLARCREELRSGLAELRALLAPPEYEPLVDNRSLAEELEVLAHEAGDVELERPAEPSLPAHLEPLVRHFVAEAVRNALKHGNPTRIEIRIEHPAEGLAVEVVNDRRVDKPCPSSGLGLRLLSAEAELCGGTIDSGPVGEGRWRATLLVPIGG